MSNAFYIDLKAFGDFDPRTDTVKYISPCRCGHVLSKDNIRCTTPDPRQLGLAASEHVRSQRYFVRCDKCNSAGPATRELVSAVLQWNMCYLAKRATYRNFPLFHIQDLTQQEAIAKVEK